MKTFILAAALTVAAFVGLAQAVTCTTTCTGGGSSIYPQSCTTSCF
jgi:hypothetical protein